MVANLAEPRASAPIGRGALLVEPEAVPGRRLSRSGKSDWGGAIAQRIVLFRAAHGTPRDELCKRFGFSLKAVSDVLTGTAWIEYTRPLRRRLHREGVIAANGGRQDVLVRLEGLVGLYQGLLREAGQRLAKSSDADDRAFGRECSVFGMDWEG